MIIKLKDFCNFYCQKVIFFCLIIVVSGCNVNAKDDISEKIIKEINDKCVYSNTCQISLKEVFDFEWDKMALFQVGSSNIEISKALGVEYSGSTDLMSGMLFVLKDKIIHEETVGYDPEHPSKLQYTIEKSSTGPNCISFTVDEAILVGTKKQTDGKYYYKISVFLHEE